MEQYLSTVGVIKRLGVHKGDRTGTGTQSHFGMQRRYSLRNGQLPVVTTKKIHLKSVIHELIWMLSGDTKVDYLIANGVRIWNEWVKPETAVYVNLDEADIRKAIDTKVGGKWLLRFVTADVTTDKVVDLEWITGDMNEAQLVEFWAEYPKVTTVEERAEFTKVIQVGVVQLKQLEKDGDDLARGFAQRIEMLLYRHLFGKDPVKLVGGDLGPVYGKVWRNIDDTRIVPKTDWVDYQARGFDFVVDIPGTDIKTDQCVVTRKIDQLQDLIDQLKKSPDSRRLMVNLWDPRVVDEQALPPCHYVHQFWTRELSLEERYELYVKRSDEHQLEIYREAAEHPECALRNTYTQLVKLSFESVNHSFLDASVYKIPRRAISCMMTMRSVDTFLGLPFNIMFYSLLTHMLANQLNMVADEFIWSGGDCHIYSNHQEQTDLQLTREPFNVPTVSFKPEAAGKDVREITEADFEILNYEFHPHIAGKVAV